MNTLALNGNTWVLTGYWQHFWRMERAENAGWGPATPPIPATVPGAVHADLRRAGLIPDWNCGLDAFKSEWVNNREWSLRRTVVVPEGFGERIFLECDGLDYSGHVLIDGRVIADFEGTLLRHCFDLTAHVRPGRPFLLEFIFHLAPQLEGQIGFTSRTRIFKPRFGYCWDWMTRVVNVGIWQEVRLVGRGPARLEHVRVIPRADQDLRGGTVSVHGRVAGPAGTLRYVLTDPDGRSVAGGEQPAAPGEFALVLRVPGVRLWWPANMGNQPLYHLTLEWRGADGRVSDRLERTVGFKRIRWLKNPGGPAEAEPFLCEVNGRPVMLRGVNWIVPSPLYGAVSPQRYRALLHLYRHMNANVLRVWGGAILETPVFYDLCDRLGLLVWQELPLSSSGLENWPPEDGEVIEKLAGIAAEYVERRGHHPCHLLWCGGNELQGGSDGSRAGVGRPVGFDHPLMDRLRRLFEELDPGKRFLPTSPSGPRFSVDPAEVGRGLHHMVHGPWANVPLAERYAFFNSDDCLFRSESGAPGCASRAALERYRGDQSLWPPTARNIHWLTPAKLWIPTEDVRREFGLDIGDADTPPPAEQSRYLDILVKASRYLQAESYRYAAEAGRRRFPTFSGYIVWCGHDVVHCTANNSLVQIDAATKPAWDWLQRAFAPRHVSLEHERIDYPAGGRFTGRVWVHRDEAGRSGTGRLTVRLRGLDGRIHDERTVTVAGDGPGFLAAEPVFEIPLFDHGLFVVELRWEDVEGICSNRYLLSQRGEQPLAAMLDLPEAVLEGRLLEEGTVRVHHRGSVAAIGVRLECTVPDVALLTDHGHFILFPEEAETIAWTALPAEPEVRIDGLDNRLAVTCFNQSRPLMVCSSG